MLSKVVYLDTYRWRKAGRLLRQKLSLFAEKMVFDAEAVKAQELYLNSLNPAWQVYEDDFTLERCFEWFIFDYQLTTGQTVAELFYTLSDELSPWEEKLLQLWCKEPIAFFEYLDTGENGITLRCWHNQRKLVVRDYGVLSGIEKGSLLYVRVLPVGEEYEFSTGGLIVPAFMKSALLGRLEGDLKNFMREKGLRKKSEAWPLFLKERACSINALVMEITYALVYPHVFDNEKVDAGSLIERLAQRLAQRVTDALLDEFYARWADKPQTILGGLTPREACRTPEGRRQVETLLNELETVERKRLNRGEPFYNLQRVRSTLNQPVNDREEADLENNTLGLRPEEWSWREPVYAEVARLVQAELVKRGCSRQRVRAALQLWHDYCEAVQPRLRKASVWAATIVYTLGRLEMMEELSQQQVAESFKVSSSSISHNFRVLCETLNLLLFDTRYVSAEFIKSLQEKDPLLAQILQKLKL